MMQAFGLGRRRSGRCGWLAVVTILVLVGCSGGRSGLAPPEPTRASPSGRERVPSLEEMVDRFLARYPDVIVNEFGVASTRRYDGIVGARLGDRPYGPDVGPEIGYVLTFLGLSSPEDLVARARVAVEGEVLAIGRPHFNSDDGGFWHPQLHDEPGIVPAGSVILRDVLFRVDDVWGRRTRPSDLGP